MFAAINHTLFSNPFVYTFILASLYAFITKLGYSQVAELIYGAVQATLGRSSYREFIQCWRELKQAKAEVKKVSPQVSQY